MKAIISVCNDPSGLDMKDYQIDTKIIEGQTSMSDIYVVTMGAKNRDSMFQYAFYDLEEAKKCRDLFDMGKGASGNLSTIHILTVYHKCPFYKGKENE